jgi:hydroxymethylpyrimidine/phosphomethylpyrimidine kinase
MQTILTIAGFDPSSGAGMTADLETIAAHGFFGTSAITALTVQSTLGVRATHPVDAAVLREMLECLAGDLPPAGIKIGMLASEANVGVVQEFLLRLREQGSRIPVVLDPVMRSSSGRELLSAAGVDRLKRDLLPLVDWVTPNIAELAMLAGCEVRSADQMERAGLLLQKACAGLAVAATGGHLAGGADDLVIGHSGRCEWQPGERIASRATHGTGCAYATALACGLAQGLDEFAAARAAKQFVAEAIQSAPGLGGGNGPMNLLWPLRAGAGR